MNIISIRKAGRFRFLFTGNIGSAKSATITNQGFVSSQAYE